MSRSISFKLNDTDNKADLEAYARSRGFFHASAMARHAFYTYLAKCHYAQKTGANSEPGSVDTLTAGKAAVGFGKGQCGQE